MENWHKVGQEQMWKFAPVHLFIVQRYIKAIYDMEKASLFTCTGTNIREKESL